MELATGLIFESVIAAFFSSLVTQIVKVTIDSRVKEENRTLIYNSVAFVAAVLGVILVGIYLEIEWNASIIAKSILMAVIATGLSILGYKGVHGYLKRVSPPTEKED